MNKSIFFITLSVFMLGDVSFCHADKIYLKNGKVYEGKLLGRSEKRFLFSVNAEGEKFPMSFFPEDISKLELDKESMDTQIPYLKEVETLKVKIAEDSPKIYEMSLFKESQLQKDGTTFSEVELKKALGAEEAEYYDKFNAILKRYIDKFSFIQNIYANTTIATREDYEEAKKYLDELYFELNNIFVPAIFKKSHMLYLASVKASYLAFNALDNRMLDEASKQIKFSEETKQRSMAEFRQVILNCKAATEASSKQDAATRPQHENRDSK
ncbi:MAG: hypothetical protein ABIC68_05720 [Candidatus Omnitrophota bacterium]